MEKFIDRDSYVLIQPDPHNHTIDVTWQYLVFYRNEAGKRSCFIPAFNIFFSAADEKAMDMKAEAFTKMHMDHFVLHTKGGIKALAMQLHKLGFKAKDDAMTLKRIFNNQIAKTKFNALAVPTPSSFSESKAVHHKKEFALAD